MATTIVMSESNATDYPRKWPVERFKGLLVRKLFNCGVAGGKRASAYLRQLGISPSCIGIGYDMVDNDFFSAPSETPVEPAIVASRPYFLFVGRLAHEKNVSGLLRVFDAYRASGGDWSLVIAGDGPLNLRLREEASMKRSASKIFFVGYKAGRELHSLYASAGCFVLPSLREPWGLVVNEAMASGLPVIVSSRCGCSDDLVLDGQNGYVFNPSSHQEFLYNLVRISKLPPAERALMGMRSREIVSYYSPQLWANEIQRLSDLHLSTKTRNQAQCPRS
jgi:glycosyltransferase involved in cell wall biosynthesis